MAAACRFRATCRFPHLNADNYPALHRPAGLHLTADILGLALRLGRWADLASLAAAARRLALPFSAQCVCTRVFFFFFFFLPPHGR